MHPEENGAVADRFCLVRIFAWSGFLLGQEFSYGKLPSAAAFFTVPKQKCFDHTDTEGGFAKQNSERAVPQSGIRRRNTQIPKTQHDKTVVITLKICTEIQEGVPLLIIPIRHDII